MKSLGETLINAREAKGWTLEHVARETNIVQRYLSALEAEDFSPFSSGAYATGFLRNYGEYLGLDVPELLSLYRTIQIQEQQIPIEQLLTKKSVMPKVFAIAAVVLLLGGGAVAFFFISGSEKPQPEQVVYVREPVEYKLSEGSLKQRFYVGDAVLVSAANDLYRLSFDNIGEVVSIMSPDGIIKLDLNQEKTLDVNSDGKDELRITTSDYEKNKPDVGALLTFELTLESAPGGENSTPEPSVVTGSTVEVKLPVAAPVTIFSAANPYPFTLQAVFQGYCMFRWEILREANRQTRNEQYFSRGQELSVQAQNGVRLWLSNAAAVRIQTIGGGQTVPVSLGSAGEVVVADIQWVREDSGRYRLVLQRLES